MADLAGEKRTVWAVFYQPTSEFSSGTVSQRPISLGLSKNGHFGCVSCPGIESRRMEVSPGLKEERRWHRMHTSMTGSFVDRNNAGMSNRVDH
jgi:hypothetical protein